MRPNVIAPAALLLICISLASGQTPRRGLAVPGPAGVYVNLGLGLPSVARPSNGVVSYRVERRQGGEKTWRQIAEVQAPASPEELQARITESMRLVPPPLRVDSLPVNWIWQRMPMGADSLRIYGTLLPVRLALGIVYLDAGAPLARPLEYRISHINRQGGVLASFTSGTVFLPASVHFGALRVKTWTHTGKFVRTCQRRDDCVKPAFESVLRIDDMAVGREPVHIDREPIAVSYLHRAR